MEAPDKSLLETLNAKSSGTVAIFDVSDQYKIYDDDAMLIAGRVLQSDSGLTRINIGGQDMQCLTLNTAQYVRAVRELILVFNYRVEVFEIVDNHWKQKLKGAQTNMIDFEDIIGDSDELADLSTCMGILCPSSSSIKESMDVDGQNEFITVDTYSVVFVNIYDRRLTYTTFRKGEHITKLQKFLVSTNPRQCVIFNESSTGSAKSDVVEDICNTLKRSNVTCQQSDILPSSLIRDLRFYLKEGKGNDAVPEVVYSCGANLLHTFKVGEEYEKQFNLNPYKNDIYMYLDNSVIKALEIFDTSSDQDDGVEVGACQSLYQLLNKCRSNPGKRLLRNWLRSPLYDNRRIKERLDVVEALYKEHNCRNRLYDDLLRRVPDLPALAKRAIQKKFTLNDCYRLYQVVVALEYFEEVLTELFNEQEKLQPSIRELVLDPVRVSRHQFRKFVILVDKMIDLKYYEETGQFRITPSSDPALEEMNASMEAVKAKCEKSLSSIRRVLDNDSIKLDVNAQYGYFFRVTLKEERAIRGSKDVRILDSSKGSGVRFTTKELDSLNQDNVSLITEYEEGQDLLKKMVLEVACGYVPAFEALTEALSVIDVLVAFSMVAATSCSQYTRPDILQLEDSHSTTSKSKYIDIVGCRHPMIEKSENVHYIPNDLGYREGHEDTFVVLTGANMGGKSTYLRSIAITVLMAQVGSYVPCEKAVFSPFDGIYTRIGAGDYQCKGVSTFMAEMVDCATILGSATNNSLVIIDELGRGTSTFDGFGLAWAIAEYLIEVKKSFTLFATHFQEITEMQKKHNCVRNMKVDTQMDPDGHINLLYRVVDGISDRSFGLNVCKTVMFPGEILEDAASILERYEREGQGGEMSDAMAALRGLIEDVDQFDDMDLKKQILSMFPDIV
uniref:DNA_MISMATCH_REPAIR_2 domain-containing protein n=1 Tax=Steinernema glaseri TaxID=37863 RepID=A0A1I8AEZ6_9BILA